MGSEQFWSAGPGETGASAEHTCLGDRSDRSSSVPDFSWSDPHSVPHSPRPGVLLWGQQIWPAGAQQGGPCRYG